MQLGNVDFFFCASPLVPSSLLATHLTILAKQKERVFCKSYFLGVLGKLWSIMIDLQVCENTSSLPKVFCSRSYTTHHGLTDVQLSSACKWPNKKLCEKFSVNSKTFLVTFSRKRERGNWPENSSLQSKRPLVPF